LGLAYSLDGTRLAVVSWSQVAIIVAASGITQHMYPGRGYAITMTPDGSGCITGNVSPGNDVIRRHIVTGESESIGNLNAIWLFNRLRYSPDGKFLAGLGEQDMLVIDARTGQFVTRGPGAKAAGVGALVFHPIESLLVYSAGAKLIVYDLNTQGPIAERTRSKKYIQDAAFTPDGKHLITVSNDTMAVLWETATWSEVREFAWEIGPLKSVAIAPDGNRAACASDRGRVVVWDLDV
jgi:WD40 repeat protein